jgi:O-antigen ligase
VFRPGRPLRRPAPLNAGPIRPAEDGSCLVLVFALLAEHLAFAGNRVDLSLVFAALQAALLAFVLSEKWGRQGLLRLKAWGVAGGLFAMAVLAILFELAPLPFGGDQAWRAVGERPIAAIYPLGVLIELTKLLGYASLFTLAAILAADLRRAVLLARLLVWGGALFGAVCITLHMISPTDVFGWQKPFIAQNRLSGLFSSANTAATVFGLNGLLSAGALLRTLRKLGPSDPITQVVDLVMTAPVEVVGFILSLDCLLLTGSRGGLMAFVLTFGMLLFFPRPGGRRGASRSALFLMAAFGLVVVISGGLTFGRYLHAAVESDLRRQWAAATESLITAAPAQGFGLGSFPILFKAIASPANFVVTSWAGSAHNVYLQWLVEGGLMGFIPMAALIGFLFVESHLGIPDRGPAATWRPILACCILLVLIHSLVEYSLQEPSIAAFFAVILGLSHGFASQDPSAPREANASAERPGR